MTLKNFFLLIFSLLTGSLQAQILPAAFPLFEERLRLNQLDSGKIASSFLIRPIETGLIDSSFLFSTVIQTANTNLKLQIYPAIQTVRFTNKRSYGFGDNLLIPTPGWQLYMSGGIGVKFKGLNLEFRPEFSFSENKNFQGFSGFGDSFLDRNRFLYWNTGDNPERFGKRNIFNFWWGQSAISYNIGAFQVGLATHNIWWGPGQFNSLTFSNNAQGFPHISFNTRKPLKTFFGNVEVQLLSGILESTRHPPTQLDSLNTLYFEPYREKSRYLNALTFNINPKWVPGLFFGATRTVHTYTDSIGTGFIDVLPVFWGVTKESVGSDLIGESDKGRSQQITVFARYVFQKAKAEIYFEFGRRDHAFNWRDFFISPEHARAYILGFNKLTKVGDRNRFLLIRGEVTHQQESVNRYVRYTGIGGGFSWHMNGSVGGFTNHGQPLGVGIGTGSNIQNLEFSLIRDFNKIGIFLERIDSNIDYYHKVNFGNTERRPWVDLSMGFLFNKQWNNLILSSKLQLINGINYQWQLAPDSTPEYPKGENLFSIHSQVSLIYLFQKKKESK